MKNLISLSVFFIILSLSSNAQPNWDEVKNDWIDPVKVAPEFTSYKLFSTPSRGANTQGSYLVYLPASYQKEVGKRYPVIYWLHGGNGYQREGAWMVKQFNKAIKEKSMPEVIVILVQGLPGVRYINTPDGTRPVEDVVIKDLIPHVDSTYRTINNRLFRGIEGMSMGGYGALHLGFKYPELFGVISALAPSILPLKDEHPAVQETFGNDENYFKINDPFTLVKENVSSIQGKTKIRVMIGDSDPRLEVAVSKFHDVMDSLKVIHQYEVIKGAKHDYVQIISLAKFNTFLFWADAFGKKDK